MRTKSILPLLFLVTIFLSSCTWKKIENELQELIVKEHVNKGISITYPYNKSILPLEFPAPTFEWIDSSNFSNVWYVFLISHEGKVLLKDKVSELKWKPDSAKWTAIKSRNIENTCNFYVIGKNNDNIEENSSWAHLSFKISKDSVGAEIFFRAVTLPFSYAVKNVHTIEWYMGSVDGSKPRKMLDNMPVCANCHSFSGSGSLAMDVDYGNDKGSYAIAETKDTCLLTPTDIISWSNFKKDEFEPTFGLLSQISPNGKYVLSTVKDLSVFVAVDTNPTYSQLFFPIKGIIGIYNRETKNFSELQGANDQKLVQSNPSWSPDGKKVVFARTNAYVSERVVNAGRALLHPKDVEEFIKRGKPFKYDLYTIQFNDGAGAKPNPLKGASENGMSNYFPKFSPDGKWIVFCRAKNFMLLQPDSKLYIIPAEGGEARLMNCNMEHMNSWHSWSPNGKWLVFSSKQRGKYTQLYLTHIDEQGNDSPPVLLENLVFNERAINIPEFYPKEATGFKKIKDSFSNTAPYYEQIAGDQIENQYYKRAWLSLEKAIAIDSNYLEAYFKRITLNALLHQSGSKSDRQDKLKARKIIESLLAKNSDNEHLSMLKATILSNLGNNEEALKIIQQIVKDSPKSIKAYELQASIFRKNLKYEKTIPIYQQLIALRPSESLNYKIQIANAYKELKNYSKALGIINELLLKYPNEANLKLIRSQIYMETNQLEMAKSDLIWLTKSDESNYKYFKFLAQYYLITKNTISYKQNIHQALILLNKAVSKNSENMDLLFDKASIQFEMKEYDNAIQTYSTILSQFPNNYESLKQLARIKLLRQSWAEAIATYNILIDNYNKEEEFYNNSALAYIKLESFEKAANCLEIALNINPDNIDARYNKARLHKMMNEDKQFNNEVNEIRKILEKKKQKGTINNSELELYKSLN